MRGRRKDRQVAAAVAKCSRAVRLSAPAAAYAAVCSAQDHCKVHQLVAEAAGLRFVPDFQIDRLFAEAAIAKILEISQKELWGI